MEHAMSLRPYLFFTGTCRQAMTRYQEILGGRLDIMTVGDMPEGEEPPPGPPNPDLVIHAALALGDGDLLMASDDPTGDASGMKGMALSLTLADRDEATRIFDSLAEGGETTMPMGETFWSPWFGMCTDRFGTAWMIDVEGEEVPG
jgi:PhnB protein